MATSCISAGPARSPRRASQGYDKSASAELHVLVEHVGPFHEGEHIFREGDAFNVIAAVRGGTVKTYVNDARAASRCRAFSSRAK